jgi:hypothetical protein
VLMGVLFAGLASGRMRIMTTRQKKWPEQNVRLLGQADRLLADVEVENAALKEIATGKG